MCLVGQPPYGTCEMEEDLMLSFNSCLIYKNRLPRIASFGTYCLYIHALVRHILYYLIERSNFHKSDYILASPSKCTRPSPFCLHLLIRSTKEMWQVKV